MSKFCRICGKELLDDSQFCDGCGTPIEEVNNNTDNIQEPTQEIKQEEPVNNTPVEIKDVEYSFHQTAGVQKEYEKQIKKADPNNVPIWLVILILVFVGGFFYVGATGGLNIFDFDNEEPEIETYDTENIEYQKITVDELIKKLDDNAASAKEEYNGKYLEITGTLRVIDADLEYIGIYSSDGMRLIGVHCDLKDDATKEKVKSLTTEQSITVRGKVTDVGEVLGYYFDIYEIL